MIEFTPTIEDSVALSLAVLDKDGTAAKQQRSLWRAGLGASLLVFMGPVAWFVFRDIGPINPLLGILVTALICVLPWLGVSFIWPDLPRRWLTRTVRRQVKRRQRTRPLLAMRIWLDADGLAVESSGGQTHVAWCGVLEVGETPDHVFILISKKAGYVVPKRVDPVGVAAFAMQLKAGAAANRVPVTVPPTVPVPDIAEERADSSRPDDWVPPVGVMPLGPSSAGAAATSSPAPRRAASPSFPAPALPTFTFSASMDDLVSGVLDFPPRRKSRELLVLKAGWRRWAVFALNAFLLTVICALVLHLKVGLAVLIAGSLVGVSALLQWYRLHRTITRQLPVTIEREARLRLVTRGDQLRVGADVTGLTLGDAVTTQRLPWPRVELFETERHVIVGSAASSFAIPLQVGQPLLDLIRFARICGVD